MNVTREELLSRLDDRELTILDVRTPDEYHGREGYDCDPRQGHIPGARNLDFAALLTRSPEQIRADVGLPRGAEIVAYCHSGSRSSLAVSALCAAGYDARNYVGSWHEWSQDPKLPTEA